MTTSEPSITVESSLDSQPVNSNSQLPTPPDTSTRTLGVACRPAVSGLCIAQKGKRAFGRESEGTFILRRQEMNNRIAIKSCAAALLSVTVVSAQIANQTPTQSPVQGSTQGIRGQTRVGTDTQTATPVTVTGCVARESDQTKARGGALGAGAGNEFVLSGATMGKSGPMPSAQTAGGVSGSTSTGSGTPASGTTGGAVGTSGTPSTTVPASGGASYSLTGDRESELALHVGKRVEIIGTLGPNTAGASANAGVGAGSASPQAGASADTKGATNLRQLTIVSFRPVEGTCQ